MDWNRFYKNFSDQITLYKWGGVDGIDGVPKNIAVAIESLDFINDLKELFKQFLRESSDDYCSKCVHCEPTRCSKGAWHLDENGNIENDKSKYASDYCIEGLYLNFIKERKK